MRIKVWVLTALSGLSLAAMSTPAMANGCGFGGPANCDVGVKVMSSNAPSFGPMTISNDNPLGYLRTVNFQRSPHVSITRIHGMAPSASLGDAPSGFTNGCHPTSTKYCRANAGTPVSVQLNAAAAPVQAPTLRTWVGQGYDPSKFQARQYGDNTFTPGIAYIPTSIVDRNPLHAQAMLNGGTVSQPAVTSASSNFSSNYSGSYAPATSHSGGFAGGFGNAGQPSAPVAVGNGIYGSNVGANGTYWEKTSGVTRFGNTIATQVICKRQLPQRVVNPIVNVPVGVPTPVAVPVSNCHPGQFGHAGQHLGQQNFGQQQHAQARYGAAQGSRWVN